MRRQKPFHFLNTSVDKQILIFCFGHQGASLFSNLGSVPLLLGLALVLVNLVSEALEVIRMDLGRSLPELEPSEASEVIRMVLGEV